MDEIRVIARALARGGKEEQLRTAFAGMLAPTRAEKDADSMSAMSPTTKDSFTFTRSGRVKMHSIAIQRHHTISN